MIATLVIWAYIFLFSYVYGWTTLDLAAKFFRVDIDLRGFSKALIILAGLLTVSTLAAFLSLFLNLGWLAQALFLLLGVALSWRMTRQHALPPSINLASISKWLLVLLALAFLTVLENTTHVVSNSDTGIYHAQAIRWIETYPAVPGLGNLHSRLAYDSNWLVVNAFFSFSFLGLRSFHVLPGAFLVLALVYFRGGTRQLLQGKISLTSVAKTAFIPLAFYTLRSQISSPGTDFPASLGIWVVFALWLDYIEGKVGPPQGGIRLEEILLFILPVYLITVKLSAAPLLLLSVFILVKYIPGRNYRSLTGLIALAAMVLLPWFARNLILSGYWIYPLPAVSFLSPNWDWKIPLKSVMNEQRVIQAWARLPGVSANKILAMPLVKWLNAWFSNLTRNQRFLVIGAACSPILYAVSSLVLPRKMPQFAYLTFAYLASYCGLAFWLFEAPDIRFGYGFVVNTALLACVPLLTWIMAKIPSWKIPVFSLITLIILYQAFVLVNSIDFKTLPARAMLPADYPILPTNYCPLHGFTVACAEYYNECFYNPFPCIPPGSASSQVEMRGETYGSGFRAIKKP